MRAASLLLALTIAGCGTTPAISPSAVRVDLRDGSLVFEKAEGRAPEGAAEIPAEVSV